MSCRRTRRKPNSQKRAMSQPIKIAELFASLPFQVGAEYAYSQPIMGLDVPGISAIYGLHLAIWQLRDQDLQNDFPLDTLDGRCRFLAWCVLHGRREYAALRQLTPFWKTLSQPASVPYSEWSGGISRFLQLVIHGRSDLGIDSELKTSDAQRDALYWFFGSGGWQDLAVSGQDIPGWQRRFLLDQPDLLKSRFARLLSEKRPDLQAIFRQDTAAGLAGFKGWLDQNAPHETGLPLLQKIPLQAWPEHTAQSFQHSNESFGVNLIGYAFGELGIGEDVRMAAHACQAAGIPFCVIDFAPGSNVRQQDRSIAQWITDTPRYGINIVCLTAMEHLRLFLTCGAELFRGRYTIGYWPWELHNWPANWEHCFNLIDEAWASSRHIEQAMQRASPVPVRWMPMAVRLPDEVDTTNALRQRARFGLPQDKTLFVFSFDGNSFISRKNPLGVVEAFLRAFTSADQHVGLVIKCMRPDPKNSIWRQIQSTAQNDSRIFIIDAMLEKTDVLELYRACDCFVSLHRAEGFGRGIAEALLLGLEVIATDYGGNTDFCRAAGARLVPFRLQVLEPDEYIEAEGQFWAEPDIGAAAQAMIDVANRLSDENGCSPLAHGQRFNEIFSTAAIGAVYRRRIADLIELKRQP